MDEVFRANCFDCLNYLKEKELQDKGEFACCRYFFEDFWLQDKTSTSNCKHKEK